MTQDDDGFRPRQLRGEFEAADDIDVDEVTCDAGDEDIADMLIEDQLRRNSAVDAPDDRRKRCLPRRGRSNLCHEIAVNAPSGDETRIAVFQPLYRAGW
ncbi:MAG TPA: hypothetical protein VNU73_00910, partial [Steroidobacteraceae bacterium]|nr:hypothetical protein [Steroidobacteraceae bacterium]